MRFAAVFILLAGCVQLVNDGIDALDVEPVCNEWNADPWLSPWSCDVSRVKVTVLTPHQFEKVTAFSSCGVSPHPICTYAQSWPLKHGGWQIVVPDNIAHEHKAIRHELFHMLMYDFFGDWDATHSDQFVWGAGGAEGRANADAQQDGGVGL